MANRTTTYILNGVGYAALLAAVIEQARNDAANATDEAEAADALAGIAEWRAEVEADINFKIYE